MLSSTSSSELGGTRRWAVVVLLAVAVAAAIVGGVERFWRANGYRPGIIDSPQLWALEREKASSAGPRPLVLLGASRSQFGFDMPTLLEALPGYRPLMLAINGHYPLAALRSLAEDPSFNGVVLCDVNARGLSRSNHGAQQSYVDYFASQWSPSWRLHRQLLNAWQESMAISRPELGLAGALRTWIGGGPMPWRPTFRMHPDRSGELDLRSGDPQGLAANFAAELARAIDADPPLPPEKWLADLRPVQEWVIAIRSRGGDVIFFEPPVAGRQRELEEAAYPRAQYWDRFVAMIGGMSLHYVDVPPLATLPLPDESHVDYRDKRAFTRAVVEALRGRGLPGTSLARLATEP